MIRATVVAYDKEQSENEARSIGAGWFRCRPEEVTLKDVRTVADTEYAETSDMTATYIRPTSTVYRTEYKIYGPGEYYDD